MVIEYCAISQHDVSKLSFLEVGYAVNRHNYIRFLRIAIIPFIRQHHGNGRYWLWMHLESAHYTNDTLTSPLATKHLLRPQRCKCTIHRLALAGG